MKVAKSNLRFDKLTPIEILLVKLAADGLTAAEIAEKRNGSLKTVEAHMRNIKQKTGCKNIAHVVASFFREKLID